MLVASGDRACSWPAGSTSGHTQAHANAAVARPDVVAQRGTGVLREVEPGAAAKDAGGAQLRTRHWILDDYPVPIDDPSRRERKSRISRVHLTRPSSLSASALGDSRRRVESSATAKDWV